LVQQRNAIVGEIEASRTAADKGAQRQDRGATQGSRVRWTTRFRQIAMSWFSWRVYPPTRSIPGARTKVAPGR